ncbi:hypothetical protein BH10PSE19_BH10PSE19_13410 [soil metagenome]
MKLYVEHIVILMAMEREARPIIKHLAMKRLWRPFTWGLSMKAYRTNRSGTTITLLLNDKNSENNNPSSIQQAMVLSAWQAIKLFSPDIIISLGMGGGLQYTGARIGDVYINVGVFKYQAKLTQPAEGAIDYGIGPYNFYDVSAIAHKLGLRLDSISHDNALTVTEPELVEKNTATALQIIPFITLYVISDYFDNRLASKQQSEKNQAFAIESLDKKFTMMVDALINNGLAAI